MWSDPEVPPITLNVKAKPIIHLPGGRTVTIERPMGFAGHPAVPPLKKSKS